MLLCRMHGPAEHPGNTEVRAGAELRGVWLQQGGYDCVDWTGRPDVRRQRNTQEQSMRIAFAWALTAFIFLAGASMGSPLLVFLDLPSLLFVTLGGLGLSLVGAPLAQHISALRLGLGEGPLDGARGAVARATLRTQALAVLVAGGIGNVIGIVQMLSSLSDPSAIGPALAVSLLTLFYALPWCGMVVWPLDGSIARRSESSDGGAHPSGGASDAAVVGAAVAFFFVAQGATAFGLLATLGVAVA